MRHVLVALFCGLASPVAAQSFAVDPNVVRQCHFAADVADTTPNCLGAASNQCQSMPGGGTTLGISACVKAETDVWDALLNEEYQLTRAEFRNRTSDLSDALLGAQRAWISFRDAECRLQYTRWQGGTIRSIVFANCMMVFTATRAIELRDMRGE